MTNVWMMPLARIEPGAAVVVAHPDDEVLWLSACLGAADRVIFCFGDPFGRPDKAAARRRAVSALGLRGLIDLRVPESGAGFLAGWPQPKRSAFGLEITDAAARVRYEANYALLQDALRPCLAGCRDVYTHNPWGEYGHAEHVQVYRAVAALQAELRFTLWFSNYVSGRSWPLALQFSREPLWAERKEVVPDAKAGRELMRTYRRHGAWTWTRHHRWPTREVIYGQRPDAGLGATPHHTLAGEWLLDARRLRYWPPELRPVRRWIR